MRWKETSFKAPTKIIEEIFLYKINNKESHQKFGGFNLLNLKYNRLKLYKALQVLLKRQSVVAFFHFSIESMCFVLYLNIRQRCVVLSCFLLLIL